MTYSDFTLDQILDELNREIKQEHNYDGFSICLAAKRELELEHKRRPFTPATLYMYLTSEDDNCERHR